MIDAKASDQMPIAFLRTHKEGIWVSADVMPRLSLARIVLRHARAASPAVLLAGTISMPAFVRADPKSTETSAMLPDVALFNRAPDLRVATVVIGFGLDFLFLIALSVCASFSMGRGAAIADDFNPVRARGPVSTDKAPIDIEVVDSTSGLPQFNQLTPELVVRFRLARAHVGLYAEREPGYETFNIGVNLETGLPMALFEAVILGPRFGKDIPGIPQLAPEELCRRSNRVE